ncbi:hypothetical protein WJX81_007513 [Elliptochloris bilobata]|uniref:Uncharacterized protein n=1 Tax=Elliptochloris bilobata TaxID=381761 RepID=A0AAW1RKT5_9CHLO
MGTGKGGRKETHKCHTNKGAMDSVGAGAPQGAVPTLIAAHRAPVGAPAAVGARTPARAPEARPGGVDVRKAKQLGTCEDESQGNELPWPFAETASREREFRARSTDDLHVLYKKRAGAGYNELVGAMFWTSVKAEQDELKAKLAIGTTLRWADMRPSRATLACQLEADRALDERWRKVGARRLSEVIEVFETAFEAGQVLHAGDALDAARTGPAAVKGLQDAAERATPAAQRSVAGAAAPVQAAIAPLKENKDTAAKVECDTTWLDAVPRVRGCEVAGIGELLSIKSADHNPAFASAWRVLMDAERHVVMYQLVPSGVLVTPAHLPPARARLAARLEADGALADALKALKAKQRDPTMQPAGRGAVAGEATALSVSCSSGRLEHRLVIQRTAPQGAASGAELHARKGASCSGAPAQGMGAANKATENKVEPEDRAAGPDAVPRAPAQGVDAPTKAPENKMEPEDRAAGPDAVPRAPAQGVDAPTKAPENKMEPEDRAAGPDAVPRAPAQGVDASTKSPENKMEPEDRAAGPDAVPRAPAQGVDAPTKALENKMEPEDRAAGRDAVPHTPAQDVDAPTKAPENKMEPEDRAAGPDAVPHAPSSGERDPKMLVDKTPASFAAGARAVLRDPIVDQHDKVSSPEPRPEAEAPAQLALAPPDGPADSVAEADAAALEAHASDSAPAHTLGIASAATDARVLGPAAAEVEVQPLQQAQPLPLPQPLPAEAAAPAQAAAAAPALCLLTCGVAFAAVLAGEMGPAATKPAAKAIFVGAIVIDLAGQEARLMALM